MTLFPNLRSAVTCAVLLISAALVAQNDISFIITTDCWGGEVSWSIQDPSGTEIAGVPSGTLGNGVTDTTTVNIPDGCYTLVMSDTYGDGMAGTLYGSCGVDGDYEVQDAAGNVLTQMTVANYGDGTTHIFSVPFGSEPTCNDCNSAIVATEGITDMAAPNLWYSFVPAVNGLYSISTCGYAACDTKIWVYDYCNMANFDDSNEATLTYNDDSDCGVQAEITTILEGGQTYYLRVGDTGSACGSDPLQFEIAYEGGVVGCMDDLACNYLPIATEPATCYFPGDVQCPAFGPDLEMIEEEFYDSMYFTVLNNTDNCLVNEGCMQGFGDREIIRFTTWIKNIGTEDYFIGDPTDQPDQFEFDACHNHWHYEGYAEYVLYDEDGNEMSEIGFKNGFCVLDLECSDGGSAKYNCGNMGITAGCGDIYSSGLSCQWIDVTNVPAGSYTFVIRTNWDGAADANGSYELSYANNFAAVCVSFERDIDGNLINFVKDPNCSIVTDCLGVPLGSAQPDCAGNCPGIITKADLDNDGSLGATDVDQYLSDILGGDGLITPCTDLDADGIITVTDAAVAAGCVFYGPEHVDEAGVHDHCIWSNEVIDPSHNVTLSVGDINTVDGYVDIHMLNPDNRIVGYEFTVSGMTISSVENLVDPLTYDVTPQAVLGGTRVLGVSQSDQSLPKNLTEIPFVRLYYFATEGDEICVSNIVDIVNENYHNTLTTIGICASTVAAELAQFSADATDVCAGSDVQYTDLSAGTVDSWTWSFDGGTPATSTDQNPLVSYNAAGTFNVSLTVSTPAGANDVEVKTGYIVVTATSTYFRDLDGDNYGDAATTVDDCVMPTGYVDNDLDCDDTNAVMYDGAPGTNEGIDNDCNGLIEGQELVICFGDFNDNFVIDVGDLLHILGLYGCLGTCEGADLSGDGQVGSADILVILGSFGANCTN